MGGPVFEPNWLHIPFHLWNSADSTNIRKSSGDTPDFFLVIRGPNRKTETEKITNRYR